MLNRITPQACAQLRALAASFQFAPEQTYFLVEPKQRGFGTFIWVITPSTTADPTKYQVREIDGLRMAVDNQGAFFLTNATLHYDCELAESDSIYERLPAPNHHAVWPRGFEFHHQTKVWD